MKHSKKENGGNVNIFKILSLYLMLVLLKILGSADSNNPHIFKSIVIHSPQSLPLDTFSHLRLYITDAGNQSRPLI